ncbi:MAG: outer membrane beta-barrel protein [Ignavibacteria bacterium]|nr:outer membrane beta-barrel protein [Ignavibacteria bacterium]
MKKILLIFAGFFIINAAVAQFHLGPKVGYITSSLSIDQSAISTSFNESFLFGAFLRLGSKVYIQPEINWFTTGTVFKSVELGSLSPIEQEITLQNIQIPINIGLRLMNLKVFSLRIAGGIAANIIVDKQIESNETGNYTAPIKETDINDYTYGFQVGGGFDIAMFTFDVQYFGGIRSLIDYVEIDGTNVLFDSKGEGFMVTIGWKIL